MPRVAPTIASPEDLLCERCGYIINGLPEPGRCPECGTPLVESLHAPRVAPAWELPESRNLQTFAWATAAIIFRPTHFFRTLLTRAEITPAKRFAWLHWAFASIFLGMAATIHFETVGAFSLRGEALGPLRWCAISFIFAIVSYFSLVWITRFAARLTNFEATARGMRMPTTVVLRGLYYHAAHYLPISLLAFATVSGYRFALEHGLLSSLSVVKYLYVVCAEVIVAAGYLFQTYWIGMRNMMYANR